MLSKAKDYKKNSLPDHLIKVAWCIVYISFRLSQSSSVLKKLCAYTSSQLQVSLSFKGNTAIVGPTVYINQLHLCSWYQLAPPYFNKAGVLRWPFVNFSSDNENLGHPSELVNDSSLYIQTPPIKLRMVTHLIAAFPGEPIQVQVQTLDELDNPTASIIRFNDLVVDEKSAEEHTFLFEPNILAFEPQTDFQITRYAVNTDDYTITSNSSISFSIYDADVTQTELIIQEVPFTSVACPPGYTLTGERSTKTCQCDTAHNQFLQACESDGITLIMTPHIWSTVVTNSGIASLQGYKCPPNYCRLLYNTSLGNRTYSSVFVYTDPDSQCSCNRSGILCGTCPSGYGVSALYNQCVTCSRAHILLLVVLVIVDIAVCTTIVVIAKPLPVWLYPCLFYIQILPHITNNFPITFNTVQKILYYVSSTSSLYLLYDFCLYGNLSPLLSYTFRYIPLLTVIPTTSLSLLIRHKKFRPIAWYSIWTLVLLMYTQIIHTSLSILNCPSIHSHGLRWFIDGSIECFKGGHIALALLAISVLLLAALLIPLTLLVSLDVLKKPRWLRHLVDPLTHAFKVRNRWWVAMELTRRYVLLVFTVPFPGNTITPAFVLMVSMTFYLFVQPYKSTVANVVETILAINSLILLFVVSNAAITEGLLLEASTQFDSLSLHKESCPNQVLGFTKLTAVLTPLYYLPLLFLICGIVTATVYHIRLALPKKPESTWAAMAAHALLYVPIHLLQLLVINVLAIIE